MHEVSGTRSLGVLLAALLLSACPRPASTAPDAGRPDSGEKSGPADATSAAHGGATASSSGASATANAGRFAAAGSSGASGSRPVPTGGRSAADAPDAGVEPPACDLQCGAGEQCQLRAVQCVRAPCPAVPQCVASDTGSLQPCGSRGLQACPAAEFCDFPPGSACGTSDRGGSCRRPAPTCPTEDAPVCGCDGTTYADACQASHQGVSVASQGACGGTQLGSVDCDQRKVLCKRATPKCAQGQVPSVVGSCYGDCVDVQRCRCNEPDACPQRDSYTCLMSAGHCTPYL